VDAPLGAPVGQPGRGQHEPLPSYPTPMAPAPAKPRRLPAASVPVVLLTLGGLCLLVAAIVFVAVTWSLLGLTGRTLVLLGFTGVLALVAVVLTRKALRGAAEAFWLIVAGMLTVDLLAAESAGLAGLDALSWRGTGALVGGALLLMGVAVGAWARGQTVNRLFGPEGVAVVGALVLCLTNAWGAENPALATTVAIPLLAGSFVALRGLVPVAAYGLGGLAAASWLVLLGAGWDRALEEATLGSWWADGRGWPLVAAAVFAAAAVHAPGVAQQLRPVAAGLALLPLVLLANSPQTDGMPTQDLVLGCATLVLLALVAGFAAKAWAQGAAVLTGLGIVLLGVWLLYGPWNVLMYLDLDGRTQLDSLMLAQSDNAAGWSAVVAALSVVLAAACLLRHVPDALRAAATQAVGTLAPAAVALGGLVLALELEPPLWAGVLAGCLATGIAGGAAWWSREHTLAGAAGSLAAAYLTVVTLYAALAADLLAALTSTALFRGLTTACVLRERDVARFSAAATACLAAAAGGLALVSWGQVMDADLAARSLVLAVYAGLVGVAASPLTRQEATRVSLESAAVALALVAAVFCGDEETAAMVLTIAGTATCLVTVTNRDRAWLGWAGAVVLGFATVIRVIEGVSAPELYTLPAAALLVVFGAWRFRTDPESSSFTVLGSGLTLALLPSLLLALDEPVSLRGALIGAGAVLVLAVGVQQRVAAPFVLGAATTGVLALRHLQPVAEAVPRWISLGGVGLVLLVIGVTWEARRRDLASAQRYLTALR
ncbi:MAG: hypothetical protein ABWX73_06345, partial [Marmoricola sp.]